MTALLSRVMSLDTCHFLLCYLCECGTFTRYYPLILFTLLLYYLDIRVTFMGCIRWTGHISALLPWRLRYIMGYFP